MHNVYGGGNNTNINGLSFEERTDLKNILRNYGYIVDDNSFEVMYGDELKGYCLRKKELDKFLKSHGIDQLRINSKKWEPDDLFINCRKKTVYIIEKKYQNCGGSVDEKLSTFPFKICEYKKLFTPLGYSVEYIYLLSNYFAQHDKYHDYFEYMRSNKCRYYFEELPLKEIGLCD